MNRRIAAIAIDSALLALVILPPAAAVASARLDPSLPFGMLIWVVLLAAVLGIIFASSRLPGEIVHPIALAVGAIGILVAISQVMPDVPPDAGLDERLGEVLAQLTAWFRIVLSGGQATNNLLFLLLLCLVAWMMGYFGAWAVFRARSAWWPVTISATALTLVLANFPNLFGYMLVQLVGSMLLVARVNLEARQAAWQSIGMPQSQGLSGRAFRASLALALALVALAWVAPTVLASRAISQGLGTPTRPWEQAQAEFNRLFGGLQAQNEASLSGFSRSMTLHGSFHLADTPVLQISSPRPEYWRVIVYDRYTGHGWLSSDPIDQADVPAGSDELRSTDRARTEIDQQVTVLQPRGSYVVGASQPFRFDRTVSAQAYPDSPGNSVDLVAALSLAPLEPGSRYNVASDVSVASASDLRTANQAYPAEIRQRYLTLPAIPERVHQMAAQLTDAQPDPYDKAEAIESYLRSLPYTLDVPAPPSDRDAVDYFLFDTKTGYCDYFASAMAVMARSEGIPARVVSGYATGERQDDGSYLVKDSNSHSWTEVYLPPYGWIPFEPSGSWPRFQRGSGEAGAATPTPIPTPHPVPNLAQGQSQTTPTPTPSPTPSPDAAAASQAVTKPRPPDVQPFLPLFYALAILAAIMLALWYFWNRGLRGMPPAVVAYAKMTRLASWLGFGPRPTETPEEYGRSLGRSVPEAGTSIRRISADYAQYRFSRPSDFRGDQALRVWRFVRNALIRRVGRLRRN
ncbi:MAG: transglutaminase TgpA family protein [Chloroflexota bacterium]